MARPLYTAPGSLTIDWAVVRLADGFQASMAPFSEAKMKRAGPPPEAVVTTKSAIGLKTWPVGAPSGIATVRPTLEMGIAEVAPRLSVATSAPLSETQTGEVGLKLM